jgi:L-threonylcarbamoyladenylate synthase
MTRTPFDATRLADQSSIDEAARRLQRGELVAFPTETVYGLGADAANRAAVAGIYRAKGRPVDHPLIVHVTGVEQARWWAEWPPAAERLAAAFWPGPLTLILKRRADAPAWACAAESTIGLRCPSHPMARALLAAFAVVGGHGVAAPSANRFGRISPTRAQHVRDDLGENVAMILDGGPSEVGIESTIVDLSRDRAVLLRPGAVGVDQIAAVIGEVPQPRDADAPRAAGTLEAHYAPITPVELIEAGNLTGRCRELAEQSKRIAIWSRTRPADAGVEHWEPAAGDPQSFAHRLYATLRRLDVRHFDRILIERPPAKPQWDAVADRLQRAAASHGEKR